VLTAEMSVTELAGYPFASFCASELTALFGNVTVFRKQTPTHIFFHISMSDV